MIAGLPLDSWFLLVLSVGIGLAIELRFYLAHSRERRDRNRRMKDPSDTRIQP